MSIDLNTKEGRNSFLKNNLNDLLEGVNDTYGPIIYEQLLSRINHTISEFNEEINKAFSLLEQKDKERLDDSSGDGSGGFGNEQGNEGIGEWAGQDHAQP